MLGPAHALSGAAGWFLVAPLVSQVAPSPLTAAQVLVGSAVCAGAALLPDIDEEQSTIARSFGPLTMVVSTVVNKVSAAWYNATKTRREPVRVDGHRTLTHTLLGILLVTGGTAALCGWGGKPAALGVLFFLLGLAVRGLMGDWARRNGWLATMVLAGGATFAAHQFIPDESYWWLFAAVLVGQMLHVFGDGITKEGIPYLAPLRVGRKAWWEFALPSIFRIRAGGAVENLIIVPLLSLLFLAGLVAQVIGWQPIITTLRHLTG